MKVINESEIKKMLQSAHEAKERAYVPYSHFHVGACLKAKSGAYYMGCNIENAAYSPTNCAERTAMFKAVSEGERGFEALAITSDSENITTPCGVCRHVLAEFCSGDMPVICSNRNLEYKVFELRELLPASFTKDDLIPAEDNH